MKRLAWCACAWILIAVAPADVQAQQGRNRDDGPDFKRGGDRVCFYKDVQFQGPEWCYVPGDELADLRDRRNSFSSIRIVGRARVIVYDNREFDGESDEFTSDVADLTLRNMTGSRSWNDRIDSFQIESENGRPGRRGPQGRDDDGNRNDRDPRSTRNGICVYEDANFRGRSECFEAGDTAKNLNRTNGWNDQISSIRVFGRVRARVYRDADYRGQGLQVDRDIPDLGALNLDDQISSIEVR